MRLIILLSLVCACVDNPVRDLSFGVTFGCKSDRELADELTLRIVRGGCDGDETVYEATLAKGGEAPLAKAVEAGEYGLEARAFRAGALLAKACVVSTLPKPNNVEDPTIVLRSATCGTTVAEEAVTASGGGDASDAEDADAGQRSCASDCSDAFACTEDHCNNGECVHEPYTGARECDSFACTEGDRCEQGSCRSGAPNHAACPDDGNPCTAETCEPTSGCNRDNAEGAPCNDQISCTNQDSCKTGICRGTDTCTKGGVCSAATGMCSSCTGAADCDDRDPCTTDSCSASACKHVANTAACNDGKSCTKNDMCTQGVCAGTSTCPADATCGGSTCRCNDASKTLCDTSCVSLASANQHCGQCGRACESGDSCQNSACKPSAAQTCTAQRYGGHDYLICSDRLSWTSARERCRSYGFGLAIIDNQAENDFLRTLPMAADRWIGASDRGDNGRNCTRDAEEGVWYWSAPGAGEDNFKLFCKFADPGATRCSSVDNSYQNWGPGEPNNAGCELCFINCSEGEDCGIFNADGSWRDAECGRAFGFICEMP